MASLPVKYRPRHFNEVVGQETVCRMLESQVAVKDFRPLYLFTGNAGTGKTTVARIFAESITGSPDEIMEIDAASNNGVESMQVLREHVQMRPMYGSYKVYIVDEAHALSSSAIGSVLKLLEEPPEYAIFIFCTTDPQKLPMTILSRAARYKFVRIAVHTIESRLQEIANSEGRKVDKGLLRYLAKKADGGMREAISLLDASLAYVKTDPVRVEDVGEILGMGDEVLFKALLRGIVSKDAKRVGEVLEEIYKYGDNWVTFLGEWTNYLLGIREMQIVDKKLFGESFDGEEFLSMSREDLLRLIDKSMEALSKVRFDPFPRYRIEALFLGEVR